MKTFIEFKSEYIDDTTWDNDDNMIVPGGKTIMESYAKWLRNKGDRVDPPFQHSFYGWATQIKLTNGGIWQMIQFANPWLMITKSSDFRIPLINAKRVDSNIKDSLSLFKQFLEQDTNLEFVNEFTHQEYENRTK